MSGLSARKRERSIPPRELLSRLGRALLWLVVVVVLLRGLAGVVGTEPRTVSSRAAGTAVVWPDEAAKAYAVEFTAAYLTIDPRDGADARMVLAERTAPEVLDSLLPTLDAEGSRQDVSRATVVDAVKLDADHALITVAATLNGARSRAVRLTVPVARDAHGGVVVNDLPSLASAPRRADVGPSSGASMLGDDRSAISDVLTRFLTAFVAGDRAGLVYLTPPDTRIVASAGGFELLNVAAPVTIGPTSGRKRLVLATVRVRDRESRATYALRYRVRLVRRDRWYVAAINDSSRSEAQ